MAVVGKGRLATISAREVEFISQKGSSCGAGLGWRAAGMRAHACRRGAGPNGWPSQLSRVTTTVAVAEVWEEKRML